MRNAFLTFGLIACFGLPALGVGSMSAYAQSTEQTDQSEEDWRKSRKKDDSSDILDAILNPGNQGVGYNQIPSDPIDSLPQDSRRHLMRERAKIIAMTEPGETPDAPYTPSEEAKTDPELAAQEEEAWTVILTDLKASDTPDARTPGNGPNKVAVAGQGGSPSISPLRGGSSQSVAEIMAQIKGMKSARSGSTGSGTAGSAPSTDAGSASSAGQSSPSGSPSSSEAQPENQSETQSEASAEAAEQAQQSDSDSDTQSDSQSSSNNPASSDQKAEQADSSASESTAEDAATAENKPKIETEPIGPLERLKKEQSASATVGSQTSASDFLKTSEKPD